MFKVLADLFHLCYNCQPEIILHVQFIMILYIYRGSIAKTIQLANLKPSLEHLDLSAAAAWLRQSCIISNYRSRQTWWIAIISH